MASSTLAEGEARMKAAFGIKPVKENENKKFDHICTVIQHAVMQASYRNTVQLTLCVVSTEHLSIITSPRDFNMEVCITGVQYFH